MFVNKYIHTYTYKPVYITIFFNVSPQSTKYTNLIGPREQHRLKEIDISFVLIFL